MTVGPLWHSFRVGWTCEICGQFNGTHEGGAFFTMCDRQIKFLSENMDLEAYRALSTISGNEIIDDEDF